MDQLRQILHQTSDLLFLLWSGGGTRGLARLLSAQPRAWPLSIRLAPTETGVDGSASCGNVALPTPSCEYCVHAIGEGVKARVTISRPRDGAGIIFCNVTAYGTDGNALLVTAEGGDGGETTATGTTESDDGRSTSSPVMEHDQIAPDPGETVSRVWTGPVLLVARYYKSERFRSEWASQLGGGAALPKVEVGGNILPNAAPADQLEFTNRISPFMERAVMRIAPKVRLVPSKSLEFVCHDGGGLFPNPRSHYSYVNPDFERFGPAERPAGVRLRMRLPSAGTRERLSLLFADVMAADMRTTRTAASLPSDRVSDEPWGREFTAYFLLAGAAVPSKVAAALAADGGSFLLRWEEGTTRPGIVFRLVLGRDLAEGGRGELREALLGRESASMDWI